METNLNRRRFLEAGAAAGITFIPSQALRGQGGIAPSDKLTVAYIGCGTEGLLELILSRESLVEQADVLNLLTRRGKTIYWTNPDTGMEYRGQRLELLENKLGDDGYAAMEKLVLARIHEIEAELKVLVEDFKNSGSW